MVHGLNCDCTKREDIKIDSYELFKALKDEFEQLVEVGTLKDISDYGQIWYEDGGEEKQIYRTTRKVYQCIICGCKWVFMYPEFPANGYIKKIGNHDIC